MSAMAVEAIHVALHVSSGTSHLYTGRSQSTRLINWLLDRQALYVTKKPTKGEILEQHSVRLRVNIENKILVFANSLYFLLVGAFSRATGRSVEPPQRAKPRHAPRT
jgi:hypothetical protein